MKKCFFAHTKGVTVQREIVNELVTLDHEYRTLFGWEQNVEYLIEAFGYLGQRSNEFSDYMFEGITSKTQEDKHGISGKLFLTFCLTTAAKVNPHSAELLWKLHWSSWAAHWMWDLRASEKKEIDEEYIRLDESVARGLRDSMRAFNIASPEVITFLTSKIFNAHSVPPMIWSLLYQVLGDTPKVKCLVINEKGNYSHKTKNFTSQVIPFLKNPNNLSSMGNLFSKWCKSDEKFRLKSLKTIDSKDTEISYLIYYLLWKLGKEKNIRRKTKGKDEEFLEYSIERLKNKETRDKDFRMWQKAMYENRLNKFSLAGGAYDYVNYHRFNFRQRVMAG